MLHECWIRSSGHFAIRLSVLRISEEPERWEWRVTDAGVQGNVYLGSTTTLTSAQVAAQTAFERWLRRNRMSIASETPTIYDWREASF